MEINSHDRSFLSKELKALKDDFVRERLGFSQMDYAMNPGLKLPEMTKEEIKRLCIKMLARYVALLKSFDDNQYFDLLIESRVPRALAFDDDLYNWSISVRDYCQSGVPEMPPEVQTEFDGLIRANNAD